MRYTRLFNEVDVLGAAAVFISYLGWTLYQVDRQGRNPFEVHIALAVALIVGLAYRLLWRRMPAKASEVTARAMWCAAGVLVCVGWVTESMTLVASANLKWLLSGARLKRMQEYASLQMLSVLYFLLLIAPRSSDLPLFIGILIASTAVQQPVYLRAGQANPYEFVFGVTSLLFFIMVGMWVFIAPTAATPREQLVQRTMIGFGLALLFIVVAWYLREWRRGRGRNPPT
ncbi:MAG: hypothetical protein ACP5RN_08205 [Armatimonadota bacterium]